MIKHFLQFLIISFITILITGCSNNTLDDIEADEETLPEVITYTEVKPIIDGACLNCHSNPPQNGAPMPLVNYDNVKEAVLNRNLLNKISKNEGDNGLMPLGGPRLPQSSINIISQWEEDGLLEN